MSDVTLEQLAELAEKINAMTQYEMCSLWRFAPSGHPMLRGAAGDLFVARFKALGGFTPDISKALGWR